MFVINKIDFFDQPVAPQVESSLQRMGMSEVDLFVLHGLSSLDAWQRAASPGGLMEQLAACVRAGQCRFRGISSHHPDALRAAIASGLCDVVMFPIGAYVDARYVDEVLPLARRAGVGTVCFKTFGAGKLLAGEPERNRQWHLRPRGKVSSGGVAAATDATPSDADPAEKRLTVRECVRYTLTADPDVALLGMSFPNEQDAAFAAAAEFVPMNGHEMATLRRRAAEAMEGRGPFWWNPDGR